MDTLLDDLAKVRWDVAARTFGSHHCTLIGLLVQWWLDADATHWALDSGPSHTTLATGNGVRGQCDAVLCAEHGAQGILEVEGSRHLLTIEKMGQFFASSQEDLKSLRFGIFLAYSTNPSGRGG